MQQLLSFLCFPFRVGQSEPRSLIALERFNFEAPRDEDAQYSDNYCNLAGVSADSIVDPFDE